ncbi:DUF6049 family protein [Streptomyces solicathayae]|uniref:DUF6049 family protein n=1 Tax=Streptomyces solicathayae TaxID=3081768 RepID=A0ABZ0LUY1_9ACTN|nr:DUF6049 family protein [Streptomyces sp. HUAS YS2]WOX23266.1 DUF6049 family protein [Streptomyces sp. HUAS YS2]
MAEAADIQGPSPSPARRWLRRTVSLAAAVPLLAGLVQVPAAPAAVADDATGSRTVDVSLDTLTPSTPVEGDTLKISGTVTNNGRQAVSAATVDLRVGPRLSSRSSIDEAAGRTGYRADSDPAALGGTYTFKIPQLASGLSADFTLAVPVAKLGLDDPGVYQLGVSLSGRTSSQNYDRVLGIERTFLPWQPEATAKKTQVTYLWPLISSARVSAETGSDDQQTPVFENDDLAAELAPGGRLEQLVSLGKELPVTWVIDPDLLATVDAMTRNYNVKSGTETVPGRNQAVAEQWLSSLEKAVAGHQVVALPFADPDLASLAHRGKDVSGSLGQLKPATEVAGTTVETILHVTPSTDFAWPVEGAVDPAIVKVATSAGAHKVIARSDSLRDDLSYTPTAARPIGGGTTAVVADASLSTLFQGDMTRAETSTLAVQRFLAHTLAVTQQAPDKARSIVVAPQRMPTASQAQTMATALRGLAPQRWTQSLDLIAASAVRPDPRATTRVPSTAQYSKQLRKNELPVQAFRDMKATREKLDDFEVILTMPYRVVTPMGNAISRMMSTSWRGQAPAAALYRIEVLDYLQGLTEEVRLIEKSDLTLSGRSATIPVTVQNKLLQGVHNLELRLESTKPTRLKLNDDEAVAAQPVKIDGGHSQSVKFTASANANGKVPMTAQLYTEDGKPYGKPMSFTVKVSEITPTVMLVIAGGVLLLVLAGVRMYSQRKRAAARNAEAEAEAQEETQDETQEGAGAADGTEAAEDDDPEQPSDPTPDTGPESGGGSGPGEKVDR